MPGRLPLAHALFLPTHNRVFNYYHQEIIKLYFRLNEIDIKCDSNDSCVILSRQFPR
ncbi:hypothetical protein TcasGA2_TC016416 [Tribolium castaneum]|uniref:Uncharacterized protein n=1 Tax=Tribolium castaneum TaxID=7070 RepID=D7GXV1_TRICA|nr:hypothetical protein TcasGA2_TC016416 [Tribolium castaneum]